MRYSLHEIDGHDVVTTTVAADRDEALEWFSEKLRLMLTFEGDPGSADYLFDEWPEGLALHGTHSKAYHSGFRPSWSWSRSALGAACCWRTRRQQPLMLRPSSARCRLGTL